MSYKVKKQELEKILSKNIGVKNSLLVGRGASALYLAFKSLQEKKKKNYNPFYLLYKCN